MKHLRRVLTVHSLFLIAVAPDRTVSPLYAFHSMAESLDTLVADSDRATATDELRRHYDSGRLTLEEFENRFSEVQTARTRGDLEHALRQLPRSEPAASLRLRDRRWSSLALQYAVVNVVCILVWALSGAGDFWPKWVLLGTLIMYLRRLGRHSRRRELPPSDDRGRT
jgi:hypothetical protein